MKCLVLYYSLGGNTESVAVEIAKKLNADILKIETVKEYPDDYDVLLGLGKREVETGYQPQLNPFRIDFSKYDKIVIGSPVWWFSFAPAIKSLLSLIKDAIKGKSVYPFATHGGAPGHVGSDFKRALKNANEIGQLLTVKFSETEQITPNIAIFDWIKGVTWKES